MSELQDPCTGDPMSCLQPVTESQCQAECRLELLPAEICMAILLHCPDLDTLAGLVHASPVYHAAYRRVRKEALLHALYAEYEGAVEVTDAIVALRSTGLVADIPSNKEKIFYLLDQWRRHEEIRRLNLPSAKDLPDRPADLDEIIGLARLQRIMVFCLRDFCETVRRPTWMDRAKWEAALPTPTSLSEVEKRRFFRGLYRLQIYGNIFGYRQRHPIYDKNYDKRGSFQRDMWEQKTFSLKEAWRVFFGTMTPWEFQELCCVWKYIYKRYTESYKAIAVLFKESGVELMLNIPEDQIDPLPDNHYLCYTNQLSDQRRMHQSALATKGPVLFYEFIRKTDFRHRRDLVLVNSQHKFHYFPHNINPGWTWDWRSPLVYPAEDRLDYSTDPYEMKQWLATLPPTQRPNIAWMRVWFRTWGSEGLGALYSTQGHERTEWKWAYAIWDDPRLLAWGVSPEEPWRIWFVNLLFWFFERKY